MTKKRLYQFLASTKAAAHALSMSSASQRNKLLLEIARAISKNQNKIIKANRLDVAQLGKDNALVDRLELSKQKIKSIVSDIKTTAKLKDPVGQVISSSKLKNGLKLKKVSVPFGVVGVVYESRPNVTVDVISLCIKSGNGIVLKGGKDAFNTNRALVGIIKQAIKSVGNFSDIIFMIDPRERGLVKYMIEASEYIDVIIPRGGKGLISFVQESARVPVIETGAGVCHTYVDKEADIDMAVSIVVNAKTQRPSVCNALDTLIVHKKVAHKLLEKLAKPLARAGVTIYADTNSLKILKTLKYLKLLKATERDFNKEFLSLAMAIKVLANTKQALDHIAKHSTKHSEAIVTENVQTAELFLQSVDAACVFHNASTRFTDGAQFGMGAEIGISTQKLHARGPMGLTELVTYKFIIQGSGQIRK